ncbi:MAG: Qat anti-phage system associated protein QatB, partial [Terriglobia bacterium]
PVPIAPPGRFGSARTSLGQYARSGSQRDMRKGLGHYIRKGLGGSKTATRRLGGTARTAGALYGILSSAASGQAPEQGSPFDPALLRGRSVDEVTSALIEAVRPVDGTQDAEASRDAIKSALSQLWERSPDVDLFRLSEDDRLFIIERFIAAEIFIRVELDVGKAIQDKAPSYTAALVRLREIKNYIKQAVSAVFRKLRITGRQPTAKQIGGVIRQAIQETFEVFEGYA